MKFIVSLKCKVVFNKSFLIFSLCSIIFCINLSFTNTALQQMEDYRIPKKISEQNRKLRNFRIVNTDF